MIKPDKNLKALKKRLKMTETDIYRIWKTLDELTKTEKNMLTCIKELIRRQEWLKKKIKSK